MFKIWIFVLLTLLSSAPFAQLVEVQVIDQHGKPVQDAVIEIVGMPPMIDTSETVIVDQIKKQFVPDQVVIQKSQSVAFPNSDNVRHHVYSFSNAKQFEIRLYKGVSGDPMLFDSSGIVVLGCNIHDSMVGYIYIANGNHTLTTNENGVASFNRPQSMTASSISLKVWHRHLSSDSEKRIDLKVTSTQAKVVQKVELLTPPARDTFEDLY